MFGVYDPGIKKWNGLMQTLVDTEIDFAIASLAVTESRVKAIDFSDPIIITRAKLYLRRPTIITTRAISKIYYSVFKILKYF